MGGASQPSSLGQGPPDLEELLVWGTLADRAGDTHPREQKRGAWILSIALPQCWDPIMRGKGYGQPSKVLRPRDSGRPRARGPGLPCCRAPETGVEHCPHPSQQGASAPFSLLTCPGAGPRRGKSVRIPLHAHVSLAPFLCKAPDTCVQGASCQDKNQRIWSRTARRGWLCPGVCAGLRRKVWRE